MLGMSHIMPVTLLLLGSGSSLQYVFVKLLRRTRASPGFIGAVDAWSPGCSGVKT
jgi:hypothetical protein